MSKHAWLTSETEYPNDETANRVLTAMIVNRTVLSRVASRWGKGLFSDKDMNIIGQWCVDYLEKHDDAPGKAIEDYFARWAKSCGNKDSVKIVEKFLSQLSDSYESEAESINPDHIVDVAGRVFNIAEVTKLQEQLTKSLELSDPSKAIECIEKFRKVELGTDEIIEPMIDDQATQAAFSQTKETLIEYPGAIGKFFGHQLRRDNFITFMGPEKRGKSWFLMDIVFQAMIQRRRVMFFQIGDLSQAQMLVRFGQRTAKHPMWAGKIKIPSEFERKGKSYKINYTEKEFPNNLDATTVIKANKRIMRNEIKSSRSFMKLQCAPTGTLSVASIKTICESLSRDNWHPDVVVIDYADLILPPTGYREQRDRINAVWEQLRGLSTSLHCLLVTATQTNRDSQSVKSIRMNHVSEEKRKIAHVTGAIAINQTSTEKTDGVYRLQWEPLREAEFGESHSVYVAGCLGIASPIILSA